MSIAHLVFWAHNPISGSVEFAAWDKSIYLAKKVTINTNYTGEKLRSAAIAALGLVKKSMPDDLIFGNPNFVVKSVDHRGQTIYPANDQPVLVYVKMNYVRMSDLKDRITKKFYFRGLSEVKMIATGKGFGIDYQTLGVVGLIEANPPDTKL